MIHISCLLFLFICTDSKNLSNQQIQSPRLPPHAMKLGTVTEANVQIALASLETTNAARTNCIKVVKKNIFKTRENVIAQILPAICKSCSDQALRQPYFSCRISSAYGVYWYVGPSMIFSFLIFPVLKCKYKSLCYLIILALEVM